jgi:IS4 transposase
VVVWDEEHEREIVLLTNIMHFAASTVAAIYKERWQIELFFKAPKQNLKVKTFVGTSENAVRIQLWTALIAILLLKFMQMKSSFGWSLSNLSAMFRMVLLTHRDLWLWLDEPFGSADPPPAMVQLELFA